MGKKRKPKRIAAAAEDALFYLAILCQELEEEVDKLRDEIKTLKGEKKKDESPQV